MILTCYIEEVNINDFDHPHCSIICYLVVDVGLVPNRVCTIMIEIDAKRLLYIACTGLKW